MLITLWCYLFTIGRLFFVYSGGDLENLLPIKVIPSSSTTFFMPDFFPHRFLQLASLKGLLRPIFEQIFIELNLRDYFCLFTFRVLFMDKHTAGWLCDL